jgi:hypothetical protein
MPLNTIDKIHNAIEDSGQPMRFLTPLECTPILASTRLAIPDTGGLALNERIAAGQSRLAAGPTRDVERLGYFVEALVRWLPQDHGRLLWINNWNTGLGNAFEAFKAIRQGLGEIRDLKEAPGHYFGPFSWIWDQVEMTQDQLEQTGILAGILFIVMGSGWDAWLVAEDCGDAIEFWEGNVLFYSGHLEKIADAETILRKFDCRREMR